jgi:hypothetical protein
MILAQWFARAFFTPVMGIRFLPIKNQNIQFPFASFVCEKSTSSLTVPNIKSVVWVLFCGGGT